MSAVAISKGHLGLRLSVRQSMGGLNDALLTNGFVPHLLPAIIADGQAYGQHGIDMAALPMHARAFQARLHHQFVGAFHHT